MTSNEKLLLPSAQTPFLSAPTSIHSGQLHFVNSTPPLQLSTGHTQSSQALDGREGQDVSTDQGMIVWAPPLQSPPVGHPFMASIQPPPPAAVPESQEQTPPHSSHTPPQQLPSQFQQLPQQPHSLPQQPPPPHQATPQHPLAPHAQRPISLTGGGRVAARVMQRAVSASQNALHHVKHQVQAHPLPQQLQQQPPVPPDRRLSAHSGVSSRRRPSLPALPQGRHLSLASVPDNEDVSSPPRQNGQLSQPPDSDVEQPRPAPVPPPARQQQFPPVPHPPPQPQQDALPSPPPPDSQLGRQLTHFIPRAPSMLYHQHNAELGPAAYSSLPETADPGRPPPTAFAPPPFAPQMPSALFASQRAMAASAEEHPPASPPKPDPHYPSPGTKDTPSPLNKKEIDLHGTKLHPDFARQGDVIIVCSDINATLGFMVQRAALARVSTEFASQLPPVEPGPIRTIELAESPTDMALLLSALVHGAVGGPSVHRPPPTVAEYLTLDHLFQKYGVRPFLCAMLHHQIAARAYELAAPLANQRSAQVEIASYLRLASICRSPRLWESALKYARTWQQFVSPWYMGEGAIKDVGEDAYIVLIAMEALKNTSGDSSWTDLGVLYNGGGKPGVTNARDKTVFWIEDDTAN